MTSTQQKAAECGVIDSGTGRVCRRAPHPKRQPHISVNTRTGGWLGMWSDNEPMQKLGITAAELAPTPSDEWQDAGVTAFRAWEQFAAARTPIEQADAVTALSNAMTDLATWLPGYDYETGTIPGEPL